ncbi:hypothetical protein [Comamonas granuli]|uniref:hypothetical protein n=1 Tax=Comamonas granuli TaxID=290309 RepID=UPI001FE15012|nr:hypothetical protein [Comamonas granuli]
MHAFAGERAASPERSGDVQLPREFTLGCELVLQYGAIELDVDFKLVLCNFLDRFANGLEQARVANGKGNGKARHELDAFHAQ